MATSEPTRRPKIGGQSVKSANGYLHARNMGLAGLAIFAAFGCEGTYGTSDEEIRRHASDLTNKALELRCLPPELRLTMQTAQGATYTNVEIEKQLIVTLEKFMELYEEAEDAGMTCEELRELK